MLHRTEGIVLKSFPYADTDLIVTIFTFDNGIIKVFAKSPLKIKSRFGSALEPFSYNRISFWGKEDSDLPRLTQADIIYPFQKLRDGIECFLKVTEIFETTISLLPEREVNKELFYLLLNTMKTLENEYIISRRCLFYKIKLLSISGFAPQFQDCEVCNSRAENPYIHNGSIICKTCTSGESEGLYISRGAISLYEKIRQWRWNKLDRIFPSQNLIDELDNMINQFIQSKIDRDIKTRKFINSIKSTLNA